MPTGPSPPSMTTADTSCSRRILAAVMNVSVGATVITSGCMMSSTRMRAEGYGLRPRCADEIGPAGDRRVLHDVAGLRRMDHLPTARIDADVVDVGAEEDEVAGLQVGDRHVRQHVVLRGRRVRKCSAAGL